MSLRKAFTVVAASLVALTLLASSALIVLRTELHHVATSLDAVLESVRIAKQLRIELLEADILTRAGTHASDPAVRSSLSLQEAAMLGLLDEATRHLQTPEEGRLLARAHERIDAFLRAARHSNGASVGPAMDSARGALKDLVEYNLALARAAREGAYRWDRIAGVIGATVAALIISGTLAFLFWARRNVLAPLVEMRARIARFGAQDKTTRLLPHGPSELQEVASTFNAMADELARQRQERLEMLGGVAHDLRNPLSVLRMATTQFAPERPLPPEHRLRDLLSLVRRQVARLDRMVGDFLDASRLEAGSLELRVEQIDLRAVAEEVVELYRSGETNREILLSVPDDPLVAQCDPGRIEQALGNLVSNAIKYSPQEGRVEVSLSETGDGEEIVVSVTDRGLGMSHDEMRRLFEPFSRVGALRDRVPGVGLGLATASKIVSAHGGRIDVSSAPGRGSLFEIRLPAARTASVARSRSSSSREPAAG